ncbi:hypothetical protein IAT38_001152 [Cryptococcus sp. DSM 104549]
MAASSPRNALPRSPGGHLLSGVANSSGLAPMPSTSPGTLGSNPMDRSSSALSSVSSSSIPPRPAVRRRSTDASGGLDYYWSSLAGAGASSSSSSLALSASPSAGMALSVSPSPVPSMKELRGVRSHGSLSSQTEDQAGEMRQLQQQMHSAHLSQSPDHLTVYPTQPRAVCSHPSTPPIAVPPPKAGGLYVYPTGQTPSEQLSPGGFSTSSAYSNQSTGSSVGSGEAPQRPESHMMDSEDSSDSQYSPVDYRTPRMLNDEYPGAGGNAGSAAAIAAVQSWQDKDTGSERGVRSSTTSAATYVPDRQDERDVEEHRTPIAPAYQERPDLQPPQFVYPYNPGSSNSGGGGSPHPALASPNRASPAGSSRSHTTPVQPVSAGPRTGSSASRYTPMTAQSGRYNTHAGMGISSHYALEKSTRDVHALAQGQGSAPRSPRSAPAWKSDFGIEDEEEETVKGKNRRTLPAGMPLAVEGLSSQESLSPWGNGRADALRSTSPSRSPEPPPRSDKRTQYVVPVVSTLIGDNTATTSSPTTMSPPAVLPHPLPTITHTPTSPFPSPDNKTTPRRPGRSPSRESSPVFSSSASISELTDMLGGAIDEIGLIDSRDTPPPMVGEPSKREKPGMSLRLKEGTALQPAAEVVDRGPMTPTSLPMRGTSLPGPPMSQTTAGAAAVATPRRGQTQPELQRKASSTLSVDSTNYPPPLTQAQRQPTQPANGQGYVQPSQSVRSFTARPLPPALIYTSITNMKTAGDRAMAYARAVNDLARAESGVRDWCVAYSSQAHRPVARAPSKMSAAASLGVRSNGGPPTISLPYQLSLNEPSQHMRNVSAGSEFPMRADSYTAREISQRVIDPADQPTALPPNLPYPQLQAQAQSHTGPYGGGGLKPSQSMQSVASFASSKKGGFFSAMRKGNGKKESMSLGPPGGYMTSGGSANKKDLRGLPISAPRSTSPQKPDAGALSPGLGSTPSMGGGLHAPRVQASISAPIGPRGPRGGSFTPPPPHANPMVDRTAIEPQGRASLDTGLARMTPPRNGRGSLDGTRTPVAGGVPGPRVGAGTPKEEDVRHMADILPHVERGVLRGYLVRQGGDQMRALGAYLEDEKNGTVIR